MYSILASSVFLTLAYCASKYFFWVIFLCLISLFYNSFQKRYSFLQGILWGIIFFSFSWYGLFFVVHEHGQGDIRYVLFCIFLFYLIVHAGLWFYVATLLAKHNIHAIGWIGTTILFFYWYEHAILWIFGNIEGYPFASLLTPLAVYPQLLHGVQLVGQTGLTVCLIAGQYFAAGLLQTKKKKYLVGFFICMFPFLYSFLYPENGKFPKYLNKIGYIKPPQKTEYMLDVAQKIARKTQALIAKYPKLQLIVMPESTFPFPLNEHKEILQLLTHNLKDSDCVLCLGGHRTRKNKTFNTLFSIRNCRIIQKYDKIFNMPLTERLPYFIKQNETYDFFLKGKTKFSKGTNYLLKPLYIPPIGNILPSICSDLFLKNEHLTHLYNDYNTIIWIVNESWFSCVYLKTLMQLTAQLRAITLQKNILYVSHQNALWINKKGYFKSINR